jgi:uncharacterized protein
MGASYVDSSVLVKRYAVEIGSSWVINLTDAQASNEVFTALVTGAEIVAAIARKARVGAITLPDATAAIAAFKSHFKVEYLVVLLTVAITERAMDLAEKHGLRGYDAVQLASALTIQDDLDTNGVSLIAFVSADMNLNKAAQAEGLAVENPQDYP